MIAAAILKGRELLLENINIQIEEALNEGRDGE